MAVTDQKLKVRDAWLAAQRTCSPPSRNTRYVDLKPRKWHMSKTHSDISMSIDARGTEKDTAVLEEAYTRTGAILMGKRMFDVGAESWGDPPPFHRPVFVLTHHKRELGHGPGGVSATAFYFGRRSGSVSSAARDSWIGHTRACRG